MNVQPNTTLPRVFEGQANPQPHPGAQQSSANSTAGGKGSLGAATKVPPQVLAQGTPASSRLVQQLWTRIEPQVIRGTTPGFSVPQHGTSAGGSAMSGALNRLDSLLPPGSRVYAVPGLATPTTHAAPLVSSDSSAETVARALSQHASLFDNLSPPQAEVAKHLIYNALRCLNAPNLHPLRISTRQFPAVLESVAAFAQNYEPPAARSSITATSTASPPRRNIFSAERAQPFPEPPVPPRPEPGAPITDLRAFLTGPKGDQRIDLAGVDLSQVPDLATKLANVKASTPGVPIDLRGANLSGVNLTRHDAQGKVIPTDLSGALLMNADLSGATLDNVNFDAALMNGANMAGASLVNARLTANLDGAVMSGARLDRANLNNASLANARLDGASLVKASLFEADATAVNMAGADLSGADLAGAQLSQANLNQSTLTGANLFRADAQGAQVVEAKLNDAHLLQVDLSGADLGDADLHGANLTDAKLRNANLTRASFGGARIDGADFTGSFQGGVQWSGRANETSPAEAAPRALPPLEKSLDDLLATARVPEEARTAKLKSLVSHTIDRARRSELQAFETLGIRPDDVPADTQAGSTIRERTASVQAYADYLANLNPTRFATIAAKAVYPELKYQQLVEAANNDGMLGPPQMQEIAAAKGEQRTFLQMRALEDTIYSIERQWQAHRETTGRPAPSPDYRASLDLLDNLSMDPDAEPSPQQTRRDNQIDYVRTLMQEQWGVSLPLGNAQVGGRRALYAQVRLMNLVDNAYDRLNAAKSLSLEFRAPFLNNVSRQVDAQIADIDRQLDREVRLPSDVFGGALGGEALGILRPLQRALRDALGGA
jgi:uncharacterized protein YjbI with pentapeptide repeats